MAASYARLAEELQLQIEAAIGPATYGVMPDGSGTYSLKTQEQEDRLVSGSKFRVLRFQKTKAPKTTTPRG